METMRLYFVMTIFALVLAFILPSINGQPSPAPAPAPAPSNDGVAIDQGIAYLLMVFALAITYMIH